MPLYEYECRVCNGKIFEIEQKITDAPIEECPECHVSALRRLIGGNTTFRLAGSGWAADNYAKKV